MAGGLWVGLCVLEVQPLLQCSLQRVGIENEDDEEESEEVEKRVVVSNIPTPRSCSAAEDEVDEEAKEASRLSV